jgi:hypothetical protein
VKIEKENLALLKESINIPKEDVEDYHRAMFTHAMEFFQAHTNFKKSISKHLFTNLL